jgi:hypothetical protein
MPYGSTFEGDFLLLFGGYSQKYSNQNAENIRVDNLAKRQKRYECNQTVLLSLVALGTLIAACYYAVELWKYFHCH